MHGRALRLALAWLLLCVAAAAADTHPARSGRSKKLWLLSASALIAANAFDIASSRGLYETNPVLRDPTGRFSVSRGIAVKSAASGGFLLFQFLWLRKSPQHRLDGAFAAINFTAAGVVGATAMNNTTVRRPAP